MPIFSIKEDNHLFRSFPVKEWEQIFPFIESVELSLNQVLYEPKMKMSHVYFPATALVSLLVSFADGFSVETALIGNEGLIGISVFMGGESSSNRAVVQYKGLAYRIKSSIILEMFHSSISLMHLFLRYTQALITQKSQISACNRHHSLNQRLCRLLLLSMDRSRGDELTLTHELLASLLGVRREGITEAAHELQSEGLIHYSRGHIKILDRDGLEDQTCECYQVIKKEYARLLPEKLAV